MFQSIEPKLSRRATRQWISLSLVWIGFGTFDLWVDRHGSSAANDYLNIALGAGVLVVYGVKLWELPPHGDSEEITQLKLELKG